MVLHTYSLRMNTVSNNVEFSVIILMNGYALQ